MTPPPGPSPTSSPATDPNQKTNSASGNSKTPTRSRSHRCSTGPTTTSPCTPSPACWPCKIAHLMRLKAERAGHHLSVRNILHTLGGIQETVLIYPSTGGRPKARRVPTDMNTDQRALYDLFHLHRWAAPTTT